MGTTAFESVWEYAENAPKHCEATADLWHWSTNYDAGDGPISLFLDMIGYSAEVFGSPLYGPAVRSGEDRIVGWDRFLGYVELDKLGLALREYADRPHDVRAWVDGLLAYDEA